MPVVLAAGASGILLHEAIGHGMEADFNRKGTSIYADEWASPLPTTSSTLWMTGPSPVRAALLTWTMRGMFRSAPTW